MYCIMKTEKSQENREIHVEPKKDEIAVHKTVQQSHNTQLFNRPQHILNKNPIPTLRLVDHDVRDVTDELSVLQNR